MAKSLSMFPVEKNSELKTHSKYLTPAGTMIGIKDSVRDLGVIINNKADYTNHYEKLISEVNSISAWITRVFTSRDPSVMLTLWKSLVLPHLDYCSQL